MTHQDLEKPPSVAPVLPVCPDPLLLELQPNPRPGTLGSDGSLELLFLSLSFFPTFPLTSVPSLIFLAKK